MRLNFFKRNQFVLKLETITLHIRTLFFGQLKLLKFRDMFKLRLLKLYYKLCHNLLPSYFNRYQQIFELKEDKDDIILSNVELKIDSFFTFSFKVSRIFLNTYGPICNIENCFVCSR